MLDYTITGDLDACLNRLNSTIVLSTYQANKIVTIGLKALAEASFDRPMGMCVKNSKAWIGTTVNIQKFYTLNGYEGLDSCYMPMATYTTGDIDIHEMEADIQENIYFINTSFSALCTKTEEHSFDVFWKPWFITSLSPVDKCHLNGLSLRDNRPRYVSALGTTDTALGWKKNKLTGGVIIDIQTNKIILDGLCMPHSPRWFKNRLWFLNSGEGSLSNLNLKTNKVTNIANLPGFTRGLALIKNLAFIGISKVREHTIFSGLPITKHEKRVSGLWVVDINTGKTVASIEFNSDIDEIFAVNIIPRHSIMFTDLDKDIVKNNYRLSFEDNENIYIPKEKLDLPETHLEKGKELYKQGKVLEGIQELELALKLQKDYLPASINLGIMLIEAGELDKAEKILLNALEADASVLKAYAALAHLYSVTNRVDMAINTISKALELDKNFKEGKIMLNNFNSMDHIANI